MAANPLPLFAAAAAAFFIMRKKDDGAVKIEPKPSDDAPSGNGATPPGNGGTSDPQGTEPPEEHDHSDYGDGTVEVINQRKFSELNGSNPSEFKPNKEGQAVLITDVDTAWTYEMRFPASMQGQESDFAEIHHDNGNILWVSTAGARPLEELKLEGIPDPSNPSQRVLLAWM